MQEGTLAMEWLDRYRHGEHALVWQELRGEGGLTDEVRPAVLAVALETMKRFLGNLELLFPRLEKEGWMTLSEFRKGADLAMIARVEKLTCGPVPPSLLAFWTVIGSVNLGWDYYQDSFPDLFGTGVPPEDLDPLQVCGPNDDNRDLWKEGPPYRLDLSADALHKADISGGPAYGVDLPFRGADPVFAEEPHNLPFTDYLRLALRWGGFPGWARHASQPAVERAVRHLTAGFQPF